MPRALRTHLGLMFVFLYVPIVMLMVLSFNEPGCPRCGPDFRPRGTGGSPDSPDIIRRR